MPTCTSARSGNSGTSRSGGQEGATLPSACCRSLAYCPYSRTASPSSSPAPLSDSRVAESVDAAATVALVPVVM